MTRLIVVEGVAPYLAGMVSALLKLLVLAALALMPFGMASAASGAGSDAASSVAASGHCDDRHEPADAPADQQTECVACSALPAVEHPGPGAALLPDAPLHIRPVYVLSGVEPEIATPPPKRT